MTPKGPFGPEPEKTFKIRAAKSGKDSRVRRYFGVPLWMADEIEKRNPDQRFECILTEQGILYRPVKPPPRTLPRWVREGRRDEH